MDGEITELFEELIKEYKELELAKDALEQELKTNTMIADEYSEWCASMGYTEKRGFVHFYNDYEEHRESIWDSIYPNKEEYDGYIN